MKREELIALAGRVSLMSDQEIIDALDERGTIPLTGADIRALATGVISGGLMASVVEDASHEAPAPPPATNGTAWYDFANSSNLKRCHYDGEELTIEFKAGGKYAYASVPPAIAADLVASDKPGGGPGAYFFQNIKGKYDGRRL